VVQQEAFVAFSEQQRDRVEAWKKMVLDYEEDSTKKNPYEIVVTGACCFGADKIGGTDRAV
jgi:hypothetical protein